MVVSNPLISIIVAVYNGEKYLRQCIDSIVSQTYRNWELLLIDDGSTDDSPAICDEYAQQPAIIAIHQKNSGQAAARNNGLAIAKGTLISFIDCDDWLEPDMYETMVSTLETTDADIAISGYYMEYTNRQKKIQAGRELTVWESADMVKRILQGETGSYLWSMLFQREVIHEPIANLRCYEDHATIFKWIAHARRVAVLPDTLYHYRQLLGSSLHSNDYRNGCDYLSAISERYRYIIEQRFLPGWDDENRRLYIRSCIKLTKDLARTPQPNRQTRELIERVKGELQTLMPISRSEIGTKHYNRLRLLNYNTSLYIRVLRLSSAFSLAGKHKDKGLFT